MLIIILTTVLFGMLLVAAVPAVPTAELYQGPVRPTDNESHFRLTGETIPLEVKN